MQSPFVDFPVWLSALLGAWLVIGLGVYYGLVRKAAAGPAKISVREFDLTDLFVLSVFAVWFGGAIVRGFTSAPKDIAPADLMVGGCIFIGIVAVIAIFLRLRRIDIFQQFGLRDRNPWLCLAMAFGLLVAAYPLIGGATLLAQRLLHGQGQEQPLVLFFRDAADRGDRLEVFLTMLVGVLVAPVAEETIFRGYIYGVLKRYCGGPAAGLSAAALFAAMHLNAASLAPLFMLALCLTLAYEVTGSLLVNMCMHAMFNLFTFLGLLWSAHSFPSP